MKSLYPTCGGCGQPLDYATGPLEWVQTAQDDGYWRLPRGCVPETARCDACGDDEENPVVMVETDDTNPFWKD